MHRRTKSLTLVVIQFACLFFIAWTGPIIARQPLLLAIELLGLGLGVWAIVAMRFFNFNITPDVKIDGYLVERGPYAFIRHPMYTSLILICLALVTNDFSWPRSGFHTADHRPGDQIALRRRLALLSLHAIQ